MKLTTTYQYINENGDVTHELPAWASPDKLLECYSALVLIRQFDKKAIALQRTGQLGTYPSCLGQEAISIGIGLAMATSDILVPYYRDQGAQYLRGTSLSSQLQYWGGDERGNAIPITPSTQYTQAGINDFPNCIPIATQLPHAAGIASAFKLKDEKRAVVVTCGDGATSRGDFYEPINLAAVWQLPMVTVINNNQWAISTPYTLQSHTKSIADKATAIGVEGITVDGNDIIAVIQAVQQSVEKAHHGKGPTLIEAISYRLCDHTTADDATRYRPVDEVNQAWKKDPIKRLQNYLFNQGLWSPEQEQELLQQQQEFIDAEVSDYLSNVTASPNDFFDYLYSECPQGLLEQRQHFATKANARGE